MILLFFFSLSIFTFSLLADEKPVEWSLPNKGKNCKHLYTFYEKMDCGKPAYEVWECKAKKKVTTYLVTGKFDSDVSSSCSPTFVIDKIITQKP